MHAINGNVCANSHKSTWPKHPASVVIDSATYLITNSSPDIDNVAMSLHDIICHKCTTYYKVAGSVFLRFYVTKNGLRPKAARGPLMACDNCPPRDAPH